MFCSIEDAWGESFVDKSLFKQSDKSEHFENYEFSKPVKNDNSYSKNDNLYTKYLELKEMFDNNETFTQQPTIKDSEVCLALDDHLMKCSRCRAKYLSRGEIKNGYNLSSITNYFQDSKDIITIFLFGLLVILLLQLFSK